MSVVVTGSIATDHLMTFPGRFTDQFVEGKMENVSLSFLVDDLVQHRGGAGANMAYGLGLLGLRAGAGRRGRQRLRRLRRLASRHGVDTGSVHWSELKHTARFTCTTDAANNQIASFYSGAMSEASLIELAPVEPRVGAARPGHRRPERPDRHGAAHPRVPRPRLPVPRRPSPAAGLGRRRADPRRWSRAPTCCSPTSTSTRCCCRRPAGPTPRCWPASAPG